MSTTKKTIKNATVNNATDNNATENTALNFSEYLNHINDLNSDNELVCGYKNHNQIQLAKCGLMVNANSSGYVPTDAYVRLKNNAQFQLQYSKKSNKFVGFNIRLCAKSHITKFEKWFKCFDSCNDNQRIIKTEFIPLDSFNDVINELIKLPKYNRDVEMLVK